MSEAEDLIRVHVFVAGRVQGVGYRLNTDRQARHLGLKGWVRNLADGRVEAVFEGSPSQVSAMLVWCRHGPISAQVNGVEVNYESAEDISQFEVRY
jgi:acylphosphatase